MTTNDFPPIPAALAPFQWAAGRGGGAELSAARAGLPGVQPPPGWRQVHSWSGPVAPWPDAGHPNPWFWLVGLHGGAGVSTLTAAWPAAGDARRLMPGGDPAQSPYVVVVARAHRVGLEHAQDFARQAVCGLIPPQARVLGLVLVADAERRPDRELRQFAEVVRAAYPRLWRVPWVPEWRNQQPTPQTAPRAVARIAAEIANLTGQKAASHTERTTD